MTGRIHPQPEAAFSEQAEIYERTRPEYSPAAVDWLRERFGLAPGSTVVDLGAGTGKLTRALVASGARVVAVEPVDAMRGQLLAAAPGAEAVAGTAEEMPLPDESADAVTVAQAFHWFLDADRALAEIHRVLRPGGGLALVWNRPAPHDPVDTELGKILEPLRTPTPSGGLRWRAALDRSGLFGPLETVSFPHVHELPAADLPLFALSQSPVAVLPPPEREALLDQVRTLAASLPERVGMRLETEVHLCRRAAA